MENTANKDVIRFTNEIQLRSCRVFGGRLFKGRMDDYDFEAVLDSFPDDEAIHKGHIVKLEVEFMGGDVDFEIPRPVAFYDRKWIEQPQDDYEQQCVDNIIYLLEQVRIGDDMVDK